ncbi:28S ribosomal protein S22, mitochondrial [Agrilus planipennis]|uniref:28S ribosomal protein S22, mitochondrial n=1 Tax=Agrilus planipennis TaxID=224129 RepID=A0A1W4WH68_AGRPL|nr:28S ribosomal protein S22, mitochondrial [Agrilus planipennis]
MCTTVLREICKTFPKYTSKQFRVFVSLRSLGYASREYAHEERDPAPFFFDSNVQSLLRTLTRVDLNKVFRKRKTGDLKLEQPTYKFLTDEQLQDALKEAHEKSSQLLQIPPVIKVRKPIDTVISNDPALQGLETSKFVFTDISYGIKYSQRIIVVRETDGTLRHADWDVRERMNQLYFPEHGRKLKIPRMFENTNLESLLNRKEYIFLLDRACIQFEPDDANYQRVTSITYQHINDNNDFEILRSTRHFGALAFFLTWFKNIDNLVLDLLETLHIEEVNVLLQLYEKLHDQSFGAEKSDEVEALIIYINKAASKKGPLELAVQAYKDLKKQRLQLEKGIQAAHGLT